MKKSLKALRIFAGLAILAMAATLLVSCVNHQEAPKEESPVPLDMQTFSWTVFGQTISISYETNLTTSTEFATIPAMEPSDQILFSDWHPTYANIRFLGFSAGDAYQLPFIDPENNIPQILVFQTKDFPGYGDDNPQGFVNQLQSLSELLKTGVGSDRCGEPLSDYDSALPFLPWVNMKQSFCARPQIVEFAGGKGIRYVTYYAQSPEPVLEGRVFYTFQGLTNDGAIYISALFPVETGIFPNEPFPCPKCGDPNYNPFPEWNALLTDQLSQLNAQPDIDFTPSLATLDEVVKSINFKPQGKP
jgi:hypothetical protein